MAIIILLLGVTIAAYTEFSTSSVILFPYSIFSLRYPAKNRKASYTSNAGQMMALRKPRAPPRKVVAEEMNQTAAPMKPKKYMAPLGAWECMFLLIIRGFEFIFSQSVKITIFIGDEINFFQERGRGIIWSMTSCFLFLAMGSFVSPILISFPSMLLILSLLTI